MGRVGWVVSTNVVRDLHEAIQLNNLIDGLEGWRQTCERQGNVGVLPFLCNHSY